MKPMQQADAGCAVTGANGYVGSRLASALAADFRVVPMGRGAGADGIRWAMWNGERDAKVDAGVAEALRAQGVRVLVHSAWDMKEIDPAKNWKVNVEGTRALLADARAAGVERVVFISTISAFEAARSEYGRSKLAAEKLVLAGGGTVLRPGLVWGERPGGMFGAVSQQVRKGGLVPVIGDGRYPQYLVHEDDLAEAVRRAALGEFGGKVLTLAHPGGCMFRDLVLGIAARQGAKVTLAPVPWRLIYLALKSAERIGLRLGFRSDSVISLVYANRTPEFSTEVALRPFNLPPR